MSVIPGGVIENAYYPPRAEGFLTFAIEGIYACIEIVFKTERNEPKRIRMWRSQTLPWSANEHMMWNGLLDLTEALRNEGVRRGVPIRFPTHYGWRPITPAESDMIQDQVRE